jgi:NADPH:quinone reductase-like Zn-dependent oxidoreductase
MHAGVNPVDYKLVDQLTATSRYPFILGLDFAGVVERVPAAERDLLRELRRTSLTPPLP